MDLFTHIYMFMNIDFEIESSFLKSQDPHGNVGELLLALACIPERGPRG